MPTNQIVNVGVSFNYALLLADVESATVLIASIATGLNSFITLANNIFTINAHWTEVSATYPITVTIADPDFTPTTSANFNIQIVNKPPLISPLVA